MQKGDIISPKGMPIIQYLVTGESKKHIGFFNVKLLSPENLSPEIDLYRKGLVDGKDDRWEIVGKQ